MSQPCRATVPAANPLYSLFTNRSLGKNVLLNFPLLQTEGDRAPKDFRKGHKTTNQRGTQWVRQVKMESSFYLCCFAKMKTKIVHQPANNGDQGKKIIKVDLSCLVDSEKTLQGTQRSLCSSKFLFFKGQNYLFEFRCYTKHTYKLFAVSERGIPLTCISYPFFVLLVQLFHPFLIFLKST